MLSFSSRLVRLGLSLASIAVVVTPFATTQAAQDFYIADDEITIDNAITEAGWGDPIITDGEDDPNRTRYCWAGSTWVATTTPDTCTTYLFDEYGQIDIKDAWFGVNETNMLLAFETVSPMMAIKNMATQEYVSVYDMAALQATGITSLPNNTAFDHDMVFAFDVNPVTGQESYDWYMVANLQYNIPLSQMSQEGFLQIYQENGTTAGFQQTEDTFLTNIDTSQSESGDSEGGVASAVMEIRQNIELFYTTTGIAVGDQVGFRLETHSYTGDTTDPVLVKFVDAAGTEVVPNRPRALRAKQRTSSGATLKWNAPKNTVPASYTVQVREFKDTTTEHWTTVADVTAKYVAVSSLEAANKYQFRVKACNASSECSKFSKWKTFTTKPE